MLFRTGPRAAAMARAAPYAIETKPGRNLFGAGCIQQLPDELGRLGADRVLLVGSASARSAAQLSDVSGVIGPRHCHTWPGATNYILPDKVAEAEEQVKASGADCVVSVGGGGPVGYGKMLAYRCRVPLVAVVTTYSGSETTAQQSLIESGAKKQYRDPSMLARVRVYDPDYSSALPIPFSMTSGMNAMTHAACKLCNPTAHRLDLLHAEDALRVMVASLRRIKTGEGPQPEARSDALFGAWLCGNLIGTTTLQYKLAHVLGGTFKTPHAETHAVILPHSIAFNEEAAPSVGDRLRRVLGAPQGQSAAQAMYDLQVELEVPTSLKALGFKEEDLPRAADLVMGGVETHSENYGRYERAAVEAMLASMYLGRRPS